ncbi:receptor-like protein kinase-related family protein [Artemisia annua]|uniref:Receptor-like protein kinase-related family protein n=1 Tax=Artemisia annua TaxID=35608 RepID=A0A2U1KHW7_ARTAN|nr:receptor-like protein kinase-related family protein [Artemisia annua]
MTFLKHYLLIFALCILYVESTDPSAQVCNENSNKTTTEITKNIDSLLTKLVQATSQSGYDATSVGRGKAQVFGLAQCRRDVSIEDCSSCIRNASKEIRKMCPNRVDARIWGKAQVFGLAQCRRDVSIEDCSSCIRNASKEIRKMCPNRVDARIWYEYCWLRYNKENFIGNVDTGYGTFYWNVENVTDPKTFNKSLGALMYRINMLAAAPGSKGLSKGETKLSDFQTLYALSQCTEDLSQLSCRQCLAIAVGNFPTYCNDKKGCRIIYSSCYVRYELYPFFFPLDKKLALQSSSMTNYSWVVTKP